MIDGSSYYENQSFARNLNTADEVRKAADFESIVYDRTILPLLPKNRDSLIYEAATGPGILQCWLRDHRFINVLGSDFSEKESQMAMTFNPQVIHADSVLDLCDRCAPGSVDVIIALDFYEHLQREDFRYFLEISFLSLKPGGLLILRGPNADSPFCGLNFYNDMTHVWAYTTVSLRALLRIVGFSHVSFRDDTLDSIHYGRWLKAPFMRLAQKMLSVICWAASRQQIRYWGSSLYVHARK